MTVTPLVTACTVGEDQPIEEDVLVGDPDLPMPIDTNSDDWLVEDAIRKSCTTQSIAGLAEQLIGELQCMQPDLIARIDGIDGVELTRATRPYLQAGAAAALTTAAARTPVTVTSGLRALPQQFLLYQWYRRGLCRNVVSLAARPGRSNHESGLAVDVSNYGAARSALTGAGFRWFGSSDRVHFDYRNGTDLRKLSVRAFQRLWNLNHDDDSISVDGAYGPQTEGALERAPASGFAIASTCEAPAARLALDLHWLPLGGDQALVMADAPAEVSAIELSVGGELVAVLERGDDGRFSATIEVGDGAQLLEARGRGVDGRTNALALDYLELDGRLAAE
jgi:hypothetical protein